LSDSSLTQSAIATSAGAGQERIYDVRSGYDLVAESYDSSPWRRFWKENEFPILKKIMLKYVKTYSPRTYIDVGCGTGYVLDQFSQHFSEFIGLDISPKMAEIASDRVGAAHIKVIDAMEYPHQDGRYDAVTATRVMSHINDPFAFLRKIYLMMEDQSVFILSDIHPEHKYGFTRMEIGNKQISIETYKHRIYIILQSLETLGFSEFYIREYFKQNLGEVDKYGLRSVRDTNGPIFYIIIAKKGELMKPSMRSYLRMRLGFTRFGPAVE
jgi:ubiquinone/menaquinone biosynthesis C-methylase UbiE